MHKNIIIVTACSFIALLAYGVAQADKHEEKGVENKFTPIFNGKNLEGWDGEEKLWRVEDGMLVGETTKENPTPKNTFLIWEDGEVEDFELKFKYRYTSEKANSGIQVRSERLEGYVVRGYQPDIADVDWITGIHYEERGRGILARRGQKAVFHADGSKDVTRFAEEKDLAKHINGRNEWNDYHVIGRGNTIITKINGQKMHEVVDDSPKARPSGIIAFQLHAGPPMTLHFKDIELKHLAGKDKQD